MSQFVLIDTSPDMIHTLLTQGINVHEEYPAVQSGDWLDPDFIKNAEEALRRFKRVRAFHLFDRDVTEDF